MRKFFHPSSLAVFGVAANPKNLGKNIIANSLELGFRGEIYPVGREPGKVHGLRIITDPRSLPTGIDLAVILVPARFVAEEKRGQVCLWPSSRLADLQNSLNPVCSGN
jgi:acetyltransferase